MHCVISSLIQPTSGFTRALYLPRLSFSVLFVLFFLIYPRYSARQHRYIPQAVVYLNEKRISKTQFVCVKLKSYFDLNFRRAHKRKTDANMQIISVVLHLHKKLSDILQETKLLEHFVFGKPCILPSSHRIEGALFKVLLSVYIHNFSMFTIGSPAKK